MNFVRIVGEEFVVKVKVCGGIIGLMVNNINGSCN
jgi:hypothetical protein